MRKNKEIPWCIEGSPISKKSLMCRGVTDLGIIPIFLSPSLTKLEWSCMCYFNFSTIVRLERMGILFQSCWRPFFSYCLWTLMFMPRYAAFFLWDKTTFDMTNVGDADGSCEQGQEFGDARAPSVGNISGLAGFLWRQKGATSPHQPPFFSKKQHDTQVEVTRLERFEFYKQAKEAYAVVHTGETALYGNIILQKGVLRTWYIVTISGHKVTGI